MFSASRATICLQLRSNSRFGKRSFVLVLADHTKSNLKMSYFYEGGSTDSLPRFLKSLMLWVYCFAGQSKVHVKDWPTSCNPIHRLLCSKFWLDLLLYCCFSYQLYTRISPDLFQHCHPATRYWVRFMSGSVFNLFGTSSPCSLHADLASERHFSLIQRLPVN